MKIGGGTQRAAKTGETRDLPAELLPQLFLVLACHDPSAGSARFSLADVDEVRLGRSEERSVERADEGKLRVLVVGVPDRLMSATHACIARNGDSFELRDSESTNGTRVDGARITQATLEDGTVFQLGATLFLFRDEMPTPPGANPAIYKKDSLAISTLVPAYEAALTAFARVSAASVPILLLGESGTGKEVLARAAHALSGRRGAFVPVNCGALPETLTESQLFGHVKGSFSGAVRDEPGFVRASDKGTLFLDEIGDMPKTSQAALLRVIQEREVTPVGATSAVKVDLRIVAATHRRVDTLQGADGFRADLYARLAGFTQELLPLRERKEDLGLLVKTLLTRIAPDRTLSLAPDLGRALLAYDWPLNVRELEQCLSVAAVLATDGVMKLEHLPETTRRAMTEAAASARETQSQRTSAAPMSDEATKERLLLSLKTHAGNISEVARELGRTRMQIHRWMKRWSIDPDSFRAK